MYRELGSGRGDAEQDECVRIVPFQREICIAAPWGEIKHPAVEQPGHGALRLANRGMNMLRFITLVAAASSFLAFSVLAQQGGTDQEKAACAPDVKKFCARVIDQGDLVILSCLQQNRANISKACNQVLVDHGQ